MIQVRFYSLLRLMLKQEQLDLPAREGETVGELLQRLQQQIKIPFLHKLLNEQGVLHAGTIIMVNRRNILHLEELATPVKDGDQLGFFPPGAGG